MQKIQPNMKYFKREVDKRDLTLNIYIIASMNCKQLKFYEKWIMYGRLLIPE